MEELGLLVKNCNSLKFRGIPELEGRGIARYRTHVIKTIEWYRETFASEDPLEPNFATETAVTERYCVKICRLQVKSLVYLAQGFRFLAALN